MKKPRREEALGLGGGSVEEVVAVGKRQVEELLAVGWLAGEVQGVDLLP